MKSIKNRITALILAIVTLILVSVPAYAAKEEEFLSEVALVYEDSVEDAKKAIEGTDWKLLEYDLNPKADYMIDDGVYLIYKISTNVEDAITDLRVMNMCGGYSSANYERQLEESRSEYMKLVDDLRIAASEFTQAYIAGDAMAALANKQLNFYYDGKTEGGTETGMKMGDFFKNMPSDNQVVQVLFEGNSIAVNNLITLLAIGLSGSSEKALSDRIAEQYAKRDTLTDELYYDDAMTLYKAFETVRAKLIRYDALSDKYDLTDENMTEEEFTFLTEYAPVFAALTSIKLDPVEGFTLADVIHDGKYDVKDFYPIAAALTEGQMALVRMGMVETILNYGSPSASPEELNAYLDNYIQEANKEYDGAFTKGFNVYAGVDRSVFRGSFAMTNAAERQQAITSETWNIENAADESTGFLAAAGMLAVAGAIPGSFALGFGVVYGISWIASFLSSDASAFFSITLRNAAGEFVVMGGVALALALIAGGLAGISLWYNYYNPEYTDIPRTMIDIRETDLGDNYIKYTAATVLNGKKGQECADLNAYEGKEWNALYYTKDATAGKSLLPTFVVKNDTSAVARRHQGISMFGETEAYNLNSNVFSKNAPSVYLTVRYSTTKKAAADVPNVVGSIFASGAVYTLTALCGAGVGIGAMTLVNNSKRKERGDAEESASVA